MITKDQANQAADDLITQQHNLRKKYRFSKPYQTPWYFRCPELNRLSLEDQHAVLQTARRAVAKDWVVNFWFVLLLLVPAVFLAIVAKERPSFVLFQLGSIWVLLLWNFRRVIVKRVAQWLARDLPPA